MGKVYVVFGQAGDYSAHHEWPIVAYTDEATAKKHVLLAGAWWRENVESRKEDVWELEAEDCELFLTSNPFDPGDHNTYLNERTYWYSEIEVLAGGTDAHQG